MCTIGTVLNKKTILFKNCDLVKKTYFYSPEIRQGKYRYIAFSRKGRAGIWAGINEKGLGIVGADAHTKKKYRAKPHVINKLFKINEKLVADFSNLKEGMDFLRNFYLNEVTVPDLIIVADKKSAVVIEFTPPNKWITKSIRKGILVRSNHFIISSGALEREKDSSSYLRHEMAFDLLSKKKISVGSIRSLCRNHQNGPSENSICRHDERNGYRTQASVIMLADKKVSSYYMINRFPCRRKYKKITI